MTDKPIALDVYETLDIQQADLGKPLDLLDDACFDVVLSPLVLEYLEDWRSTLAEFHRILVPGGYLIASVTHPFNDYRYFKSEKYFETELVSCEWKGFGVRVLMPGFRRSLSETLNPFLDAGFALEKIIEPMPTVQFKEADPEEYEELLQFPVFLCIRARK
jgi:SAM-dependent methyltransferase